MLLYDVGVHTQCVHPRKHATNRQVFATDRISISLLAGAPAGHGWHRLKERLSGFPDLAVAIETSSGAVVERLLEAGYDVYPVNPKAAKRYRERKVPSGTKTDRIDAWSLADALRLDARMLESRKQQFR